MIEVIVGANLGWAADHNKGLDHGALAQGDLAFDQGVILDHNVRANHDLAAHDGARRNQRCRINLRGALNGRIAVED